MRQSSRTSAASRQRLSALPNCMCMHSRGGRAANAVVLVRRALHSDCRMPSTSSHAALWLLSPRVRTTGRAIVAMARNCLEPSQRPVVLCSRLGPVAQGDVRVLRICAGRKQSHASLTGSCVGSDEWAGYSIRSTGPGRPCGTATEDWSTLPLRAVIPSHLQECEVLW